jgi:hypothetical protein
MNPPSEIRTNRKGLIPYLYGLTLFFITLSGFGQMPIFKRYYIADIPGLGWLAQFYITHIIHYLAAALLLGIVAYRIAEWLSAGSQKRKISGSGYCKGILLLALMGSGILMATQDRKASGPGGSPGGFSSGRGAPRTRAEAFLGV